MLNEKNRNTQLESLWGCNSKKLEIYNIRWTMLVPVLSEHEWLASYIPNSSMCM